MDVRRIDECSADGFIFAFEADHHSGIIIHLCGNYLRICGNFFIGDRPSDGIYGDQSGVKLLIAEVFLHQSDAHVGSLRKARKDYGTTVVFVFEIPFEGTGYIAVGNLQVFFPFIS